MKIHHLKLLNFRNYERLEIDFENYNIIFGNNGEGKTNLIESIYVLALTKSFRGSVDKVLIMNNKDFTRIEGKVENNSLDDYKIIIKDNGKKVMINNNSIDKLSDYISKISIVLFNPDDLKIIKDTPNTRRKNLNLDISQINNSYLKNLNNYNKVLKQRNMYLKSMYYNSNKSSDYLDILTNNLIEYGIKIFDSRKKFISLINEKIIDKGVDGLLATLDKRDDIMMELAAEEQSMANDIQIELAFVNLNLWAEADKYLGLTKEDDNFINIARIPGKCIYAFGIKKYSDDELQLLSELLVGEFNYVQITEEEREKLYWWDTIKNLYDGNIGLEDISYSKDEKIWVYVIPEEDIEKLTAKWEYSIMQQLDPMPVL